LIKTIDEFDLVSGRDNDFTIEFSNPFDGELENVTLKVTGYLSQYMDAPTDIGTLAVTRQSDKGENNRPFLFHKRKIHNILHHHRAAKGHPNPS